MMKLAERIWTRRNLCQDETGATAVLVALTLTVIMGFVGLVIDGGIMYETRRQLQNGVDAAALAGAWQLMESQATARAEAVDYANRNGIGGNLTSISFSTELRVNPAITVSATRPVSTTFARVLGIDFLNVGASATAIVAQEEPQDLWPWSVPESAVAAAGGGTITLTVKSGSPPGPPGNFGALAFSGGRGATWYKDNILNGYNGTIPPPISGDTYSWWVDTEPGNMAGPTSDAVDTLIQESTGQADICTPGPSARLECPRIGYVPIVSDASWADVHGRDKVEVVKFMIFYLVGTTPGPPGKRDVQGYFLDYALVSGGKSKPGAPLEGLLTARLWR
ncbi:MAG: pilus assembly protein [Chloroflexi bacterium]|nr:pilus assembly protein [Chloroflexota bacterium]